MGYVVIRLRLLKVAASITVSVQGYMSGWPELSRYKRFSPPPGAVSSPSRQAGPSSPATGPNLLPRGEPAPVGQETPNVRSDGRQLTSKWR
jgi:hypothetical protein